MPHSPRSSASESQQLPFTPTTVSSTPRRNALWNILPLTLSIIAATFVFWGPFTVPDLLAIFTTLFFAYWLVRSYKVIIGSAIGARRMLRWERTDWAAEYANFQSNHPGTREAWSWPRHLVVIPNYREPERILRRTLDNLAAQSNREQLVVVLAMESRETESATKAGRLIAEYEARFGRMFATYHPAGLPGEVAGKGSNQAWALRQAHELLIATGGEDIERYTVTSCDADAVFHRRHFEALNHHFLIAERRHRTFWQPIIFYFNNIWDIPAALRIPNGLSGLNRLANLSVGKGTSMPMSCYTLSWSMLHAVDYWDEDIISEDWHIYLKCAYSLGDEVSLKPILLPLGNDCVYADTTRATLKGQYLQYQRHAFGAQDIPYALRASLDRRSPLSLRGKFDLSFLVTKSHVMWTSQWFLVTLGWHLPATLATHTGASMPGWWTHHLVTLPAIGLHPNALLDGDLLGFVSGTVNFALPTLLFYLTMPPLFVVIAQEYRTRGPRPAYVSRARAFFGLTSWALLPVMTFVYGALPAFHAQWRLASGGGFAFRVAEKGGRALAPAVLPVESAASALAASRESAVTLADG